MACQAVVTEFLAGLPSTNPDNFQKWGSDCQRQNITKRPASYVPIRDFPIQQQVIVTEKTNILLRFLHTQFEKNKPIAKRNNDSATPTPDDDSLRKRPRFE